MSTVTKEIMNLARKAGYEGEDKTNVTKAIDALADTLAGENLEQATNVAAAIRKLQPYVGGGGGGEVTSYTLENYNKINISIPQDTTLQEDEVDAWVDEQIENWINEQSPNSNVSNQRRGGGGGGGAQISFDTRINKITEKFFYLLDKNRNIINIAPDIYAPIVGGGILLSNYTVFATMTLEKEGMVVPEVPHMFDPVQQEGYHHLLYAIRTERDDSSLIPLEVVGKFDVEELIEDTVTVAFPGEEPSPVPLVNYPSLNSPLSLDDFIAINFDPEQIVEPRVVLCEIYIF